MINVHLHIHNPIVNLPEGWLTHLDGIFNKVITNQGAIMSKFDDYVKDQKEHNQATSDALTDLAGDIQALTDLVGTLKAQMGTLTPEQEAALDELNTAGAELAKKAQDLAAVTPPTPPAPTPEPPPPDESGPVAG